MATKKKSTLKGSWHGGAWLPDDTSSKKSKSKGTKTPQGKPLGGGKSKTAKRALDPQSKQAFVKVGGMAHRLTIGIANDKMGGELGKVHKQGAHAERDYLEAGEGARAAKLRAAPMKKVPNAGMRTGSAPFLRDHQKVTFRAGDAGDAAAAPAKPAQSRAEATKSAAPSAFAKPVRKVETQKSFKTMSLQRALGSDRTGGADHQRSPHATANAGMQAPAQVKVRPEGGVFAHVKKAVMKAATALKTPRTDRNFGQTSTAGMLHHFKSKAATADSPKRAASAKASADQMSQVIKHDRLRAGKASGAVQRALHKGALSAPAKSITLKTHTGTETASGSRGLAPARKIKYHLSEARAHHSDAREYKRTGDSRLGHAQTEQASHTLAAKRTQVLQSAAKTVKGAGVKAAPHALQHGKKGGTFYISNGKKIYAKK